MNIIIIFTLFFLSPLSSGLADVGADWVSAEKETPTCLRILSSDGAGGADRGGSTVDAKATGGTQSWERTISASL